MSPKFVHGPYSVVKWNDTDFTPHIKSFTITTDVEPWHADPLDAAADRLGIPGWWSTAEPGDLLPAATAEQAVDAALADALADAGIDEATPSHWQRIHRARSFEAEQDATRKRLAAQWEPGKSERELS